MCEIDRQCIYSLDGCNIFISLGNKHQPPDSLFKGRQQSTGHLRLIAWRSTANTGVYLPLLTSSPNEHTFRGHRLPKNEKKTLSRSTADEGYQVSRHRDIAVPWLKNYCIMHHHTVVLYYYSPSPPPCITTQTVSLSQVINIYIYD